MLNKKQINVIEIDSRDARYQSGIARYFDILDGGMPANIATYRIVFYHSPEITDIKIQKSDTELAVHHPNEFPAQTLFEAVFALIAPRLNMMQNLIVKNNCLGMEPFTYMIKSRIYCKTIGVLHCMPQLQHMLANPFFNMDHVVLVAPNGIQYLNHIKNNRPHSIISNGIHRPIVNNRKNDDGVFRFIFANGWNPHKGLVKIMPAIQSVAQKHNIEVLVLGGCGDEDIKEFTQSANLPIKHVGLVNNPDEMAQYYASADAALFASASEACSFAGIEALAYNLPVCSTNATGLREMFDGVAMFANIDEKGDIDLVQYEKNMLRIIENRAQRLKMGVLAYSRYLQRYTAKKMISSYIRLYDNLT